jgi:hypothetical protein
MINLDLSQKGYMRSMLWQLGVLGAMLGPKVQCHYTESFMSAVLFATVNKLQVNVQTVGVFWVNTNGIPLTTNPVKVCLVVHKFKEHTNTCTTHVIKEKSPTDGGKDCSCGFPL